MDNLFYFVHKYYKLYSRNHCWLLLVIAFVIKVYLREWLDFIGIDQRELAKESGISENQISHIAQGKNTRPPRSSTIRSLAKGLGLDDPTSVLDGIIADEALKHTIRSILYLRNEN